MKLIKLIWEVHCHRGHNWNDEWRNFDELLTNGDERNSSFVIIRHQMTNGDERRKIFRHWWRINFAIRRRSSFGDECFFRSSPFVIWSQMSFSRSSPFVIWWRIYRFSFVAIRHLVTNAFFLVRRRSSFGDEWFSSRSSPFVTWQNFTNRHLLTNGD